MNGNLGVGDILSHEQPVEIGIGSSFDNVKNITQIWAGKRRTFLKANMSIYGFGTDHSCGLGFGEIFNTYPVPKELLDLSYKKLKTEIIRISNIEDHTLALGKDGRYWAWGSNVYGSLGIGDHDGIQCKPYLVGNDAIDLSAGSCHSIIVKKDFSVFGMGCDIDNQLGILNGNASYRFPTRLPISDISKIYKVSAGLFYSLMLSKKGDVYFTGRIFCKTFNGQMNSSEAMILFNHTSLGKKAVSIKAGYTHILVKFEDGSVSGYGCNDFRVLGKQNPHFFGYSHNILKKKNQSIIREESNKLKKISAGDCCSAYLTSGNLYFQGQHGMEPEAISIMNPIQLNENEDFIEDCDLSWGHLAAFSKTKVFCKGENFYFQCGIIPRSRYIDFQDATGKVFQEKNIIKIEISTTHGFGIDSNGNLYAYGENSYAQLGSGGFVDYFLPSPVDISPEREIFFIGGSVNEETSLFLSDSGEVYVVGNGEKGCLGLNNLNTIFIPKKIPNEYFGNNSKRIVQIKASEDFVHALSSDGRLYSWGNGHYGSLGFGEEVLLELKPRLHKDEEFGGRRISQFAVGFRSTVLLTNNNEVFQFGQIAMLPLGSGSSVVFEVMFTPRIVSGFPNNTDVILVEAGSSFIVTVVGHINNNEISISSNNKKYDFYSLYWWGILGDVFHPPYKVSLTPQFLWSHDTRISQCAAQYSLICVDFEGRLYGLGNNDHHQLLLDPKNYYYSIQRIPTFSYKGMENMKFSHVSVSQFTTVIQEYVSCFGFLDSEIDVCSRSGVCISENNCRCNFGKSGFKCQFFSCDNISSEDTGNVCHGHGKCTGENDCSCDFGWSNFDQTMVSIGDISVYGFCKFPNCPGDGICNNRGKCIIENNNPKCECEKKYRGVSCEYPVCNHETSTIETEDGCGFSSKCVGYNTCQCQMRNLNVLLPIADSGHENIGCIPSVPKIFLYIIVLLFIFCCCCCCCVFCCLNFDLTAISCCCIAHNIKRTKFYNGINRTYVFVNHEYEKEECIDHEEIPRFFSVTRNYLDIVDRIWKKLAFQIIPFHQPTKERIIYAMTSENEDSYVSNIDSPSSSSFHRQHSFISEDGSMSLVPPWEDVKVLVSDSRSRIVFSFTGFGDEEGNYFASDRKLLLYEIFEPFSKSVEELIDSGKMKNKKINFLFIFDSVCNPRRYKEQFDEFWEDESKSRMLRRTNGMITVEMVSTNGTGQFWRSLTSAMSVNIRLRKMIHVQTVLTKMTKFMVSVNSSGLENTPKKKDKRSRIVRHHKRKSSLLFGDDDDIVVDDDTTGINDSSVVDESKVSLLENEKMFDYTNEDGEFQCVVNRMALYSRALQYVQPSEGFHF